MSKPLDSEELQQLIAGYVLYDLSPEEAATFEQLAAANPAVITAVEQLQTTLQQAYLPSLQHPPDRLRQAVLRAHAAAQPGFLPLAAGKAPTTAAPMAQLSRWPRWLMGLGTAIALVIGALGISNYVLWRSLQATQAPVQPPAWRTVSLASTELGATGAEAAPTASIMIDSTNLEATLSVDNLPPLPAEQVYVLWTVLQPGAPFTTDAKNAILTEVFTVDAQNYALQSNLVTSIALPQVYREPHWIQAIAVTVEAADAPQRHASSPILIERL